MLQCVHAFDFSWLPCYNLQVLFGGMAKWRLFCAWTGSCRNPTVRGRRLPVIHWYSAKNMCTRLFLTLTVVANLIVHRACKCRQVVDTLRLYLVVRQPNTTHDDHDDGVVSFSGILMHSVVNWCIPYEMIFGAYSGIACWRKAARRCYSLRRHVVVWLLVHPREHGQRCNAQPTGRHILMFTITLFFGSSSAGKSPLIPRKMEQYLKKKN